MTKIKWMAMFFLVIFASRHAYALSAEKVNLLAHTFMNKNQVKGMSIAVIDHNKTYIFNYGFADEVKKIPTTNHTIYTLASFTKTFTATLTAMAQVENKISLSDSFAKYVPALKGNLNLKQMTFETLLAHVSSLPFDFQPRPQTYTQAIHDLNQFKPSRLPGSEYAYSNAGIGAVGYALQNIYAKDYQQILEKKLLQPLNMHSTYLHVPMNKEQFIACGHDKNNNINNFNNDLTVWFAAASLKSTITDMATYLYAQLNAAAVSNRNLSKALLLVHQNRYCFADKRSCEQLAWQAHTMAELDYSDGDTYFVAFGTDNNPLFSTKKIDKNVSFKNEQLFVDKTESGYGMSGYMAYLPSQKQGVVILLNKELGDERIRLGRDILKSMAS